MKHTIECVNNYKLSGFGEDNECEIIFYYHMHGPAVGTLKLFVKPDSGDEMIELWSKSGDQGNIWQRQYLVVENSTNHGPYFIMFQAAVGSPRGGDIAIDDVVFTYNCQLQGDEPTTSAPAPPLNNCNFQDIDLCGWTIDDNTNATGRFHFERKNGDENLIIAALPDKDHTGSRTGNKWYRRRKDRSFQIYVYNRV